MMRTSVRLVWHNFKVVILYYSKARLFDEQVGDKMQLFRNSVCICTHVGAVSHVNVLSLFQIELIFAY